MRKKSRGAARERPEWISSKFARGAPFAATRCADDLLCSVSSREMVGRGPERVTFDGPPLGAQGIEMDQPIRSGNEIG